MDITPDRKAPGRTLTPGATDRGTGRDPILKTATEAENIMLNDKNSLRILANSRIFLSLLLKYSLPGKLTPSPISL
jgi:hypothetical protein